MTLWGAATLATGFVQTYPQLIAVRTILGALEAGLPVAVTFLFSCWYTGEELGKRSSLFMTAALIGGGFGSLIAGGVIKNLEGARGIRGWRWLFIVEGVVTIFVSLWAVFILPDYPATCRRLTEEERTIAIERLKRSRIIVDEGKVKKLTVLECFVLALKNWRTYAIAFGSVVRLQSQEGNLIRGADEKQLVCGPLTQAYFYPTLVKGLGYNDPVTAQFMTVGNLPASCDASHDADWFPRSPSGWWVLYLPFALASSAIASHSTGALQLRRTWHFLVSWVS